MLHFYFYSFNKPPSPQPLCPRHLGPVSGSTLPCPREASWFPPSPGQRLQGFVLSAKSLWGFTHSSIPEHACPFLITFPAFSGAANNALYHPICHKRCYHHCAWACMSTVIKKKIRGCPWMLTAFMESQSQQDGRAPTSPVGPGFPGKGKSCLLLPSLWQPGIPHQVLNSFIQSLIHPWVLFNTFIECLWWMRQWPFQQSMKTDFQPGPVTKHK